MYESQFHKTLSLTFIIFLLYRLLILERVSYVINETIPILQIFIIAIIIVWLCIELISVVFILKGKIKQTFFTQLIFKYLFKYYYAPLLELGKLIYKIKAIQYLLEGIIESFKLVMLNKYLVIVITIIVFLLPRAFLGYALYIDIIILSKIYLFYNLLWIIIIPLIFQGAFALLKHVYQQRMEELIKTHIKVLDIEGHVKLSPQYKMHKDLFETYIIKWERYHHNIDMLTAIELCKNCKIYLHLRRFIIIFFISLWLTYIAKVLVGNDLTSFMYLLFYNYILSLIFIL
jgi:hypothetical protein